MRIAGLIAGSIALIVLVGGYLAWARSLRSIAPEFTEALAPGLFTVELTPTFHAQASVFGGMEPTAFELRLQGATIWRTNEDWPAGRSIRVSAVDGFVMGRNELWCAAYTRDASPGDDFDRLDLDGTHAEQPTENQERRGLRVRVFRDQRLLVDETLWSVPGGAPGGIVSIHLQPATVDGSGDQPETVH